MAVLQIHSGSLPTVAKNISNLSYQTATWKEMGGADTRKGWLPFSICWIIREKDGGNELNDDKGNGETESNSERSVKTKEDKGLREDMLNSSLIDFRLSTGEKKCELMFKNIFGLLMEEEEEEGCPCLT